MCLNKINLPSVHPSFITLLNIYLQSLISLKHFHMEKDTEVFYDSSIFWHKSKEYKTQSCAVDEAVYNGLWLANINDENFMDVTRVRRVMTGLKIKNCEGVDRISLRIPKYLTLVC